MADEEKEVKEKPITEEKEAGPNEKGKESSSSGDVAIPEEFQKTVTSLVSEYADSEPCLDFMCDAAQKARSELRRKEDEARMKKMKGNKTPQAFSTDSMPDLD